MKSSAVIIVNPASGGFSEKRLRSTIEIIKGEFGRATLHYTSRRGDAELLAKDAARGNPDIIFAVGGDGTFNEVANGLAFTGIPVAFLPSGVTNVLARELSIPDNLPDAAVSILKGNPEYISLGSIDGRYFVLMAGIGFDGEAVHNVDQNLKRLSGKGAYILSGLVGLMNYNPGKLEIIVDGSRFEGYGAIVCNARFYGGGFTICPDASLKSPDLSVFVMKRSERLALLRYITMIIIKRHLKSSDVICLKGRQISIKGHAHIQTDGDYFSRTPVEIGIKERALRIVVPEM
jgi:YegS/Rv2252/BmrU family lipid kinase